MLFVGDVRLVYTWALARAGLPAALQVEPGLWHLIAGLDADQYAEAMKRRLVTLAAW